MRLPRFRGSVRGLIALVAIAALLLGILTERRHRFGRIADRFRPVMATSLPIATSHSYTPGVTERADWNVRMYYKYEHAASYPWLLVEPDLARPR